MHGSRVQRYLSMRVGLFVTCLVDLMRPSIGFAAIRLLEAGRRGGVRSAHADVLRTAGLQRGRSRRCDRARAQGRRRVRGVRVSGHAVGILRRNDRDALCRSVRGRPRWPRAGGEARGANLRDHGLPGQRARAGIGAWAFRGPHHLPRLLRGPARARASRRSRARCSRRCRGSTLMEMAESETCCGFGGTFSIKFGEISGRLADNKCGHIAASGAGTRGAGRPGLHAEHRRQAAPARRCANARDARRRGPGRRVPATARSSVKRPCKSHRCTSSSARTSSCTMRRCSAA